MVVDMIPQISSLAEAGVVTGRKRSHVIGEGDQGVCDRPRGVITRGGIHVRGNVQDERAVDPPLDFAVSSEPLEMQNQRFGSTLEGHSFAKIGLLLASRALLR